MTPTTSLLFSVAEMRDFLSNGIIKISLKPQSNEN